MLELNRIYCGNCVEFMKKIESQSIDLVVTDPPYGIDYQSARRIEEDRFDKLVDDNIINTEWLNHCFRIMKPKSALYIFTRWDVYSEWFDKIKQHFSIKNVLVWDRVIHGLGDLNGAYAPTHDFIIYAIKGNCKLKGENRPKDVLRYTRVSAEKLLHPTQKPLELIKELIKNSSNREDLVLDPFMGSGTTAVACKQLNRNFIGFEIEPKYVEIANRRLSQNTLHRLTST